jgi:hypothetical protein
VVKSVLDTDVNLSGYNLFRQDRSSKGGGVAIFTKDHLQCTVVSTKSVPKQFDLLVLSFELSNSTQQQSTKSYRPPPALACTLPALSSLLAPYTKSEFVLLGDLNWNMLKPPDQVLKQWDSLNLSDLSPIPQGMTPTTQKRLLSSTLSSQIILTGISLVFSLLTLVITVLQPVFVMAAQ